jgi:hypothetical protein
LFLHGYHKLCGLAPCKKLLMTSERAAGLGP